MTKKDVEAINEYLKQSIIRGIVLGLIGAILAGIISATTFMLITPSKLEAHEERISCLESEVVLLRKDMNENQAEILNVLRKEYKMARSN